VRTLTSPREIDALFKSGRRGSTRLLVVLVSPTSAAADHRGGVVFIAGKKLGGAVVRNRCKRVLREAARRAGGPWPGRDVAIIARSGAQAASPRELDDSLAKALATAGVGS
jgi:ribonuclease P protein component